MYESSISRRVKIAKREREENQTESSMKKTLMKEYTLEQAYEREKQKNGQLVQKMEKNQFKCLFLYDKLKELYQEYMKLYEKYENKGNQPRFANPLQEIAERVKEQILDQKNKQKAIKELEQEVSFRHGKYFGKLIKKVRFFFELVHFQIQSEELQQVQDEVQLLLLVMDAFQLRYKQMVQQNQEVFCLVEKLREKDQQVFDVDSISTLKNTIETLKGQLTIYEQQNRNLNYKAALLEQQLGTLNRLLDNWDLKKSKDPNQSSGHTQAKEQQIDKLRAELIKAEEHIHLLTERINQFKAKYTILEEELEKQIENSIAIQKQWKKDYQYLEISKNQTIARLKQQLHRQVTSSN